MLVGACILNPLQDRHAGELCTVVQHNRLWYDAFSDDMIQFTQKPLTRQRRVSHKHQVLTAEIVDDRKNAKSASACQRIRYEIQALTLVWAISAKLAFGHPKHASYRPEPGSCSYSSV